MPSNTGFPCRAEVLRSSGFRRDRLQTVGRGGLALGTVGGVQWGRTARARHFTLDVATPYRIFVPMQRRTALAGPFMRIAHVQPVVLSVVTGGVLAAAASGFSLAAPAAQAVELTAAVATSPGAVQQCQPLPQSTSSPTATPTPTATASTSPSPSPSTSDPTASTSKSPTASADPSPSAHTSTATTNPSPSSQASTSAKPSTSTTTATAKSSASSPTPTKTSSTTAKP